MTNVEALRQKILDLAMHGKLVSQDPNDEPASVLLEKIAAEKQQLIAKKIIKRSKPLPPIDANDIPYQLPKGWIWTRISEISTFNNTIQLTPNHISDTTWVLDLADVEKDTGKILNHTIKKDKGVKSNKVKFNKNDVLYSKLRPYLNKVIVADDNGVATSEFFVIHLLGNVLPSYTAFMYRSPFFLNKINENTYGIKMPRVGSSFFNKCLIPLPPLNEQKRIVTKLDKLMSILDTIDINQKKYQTHKQQLHKKIIDIAMHGKLVPQNPNDEPASVLLEKIKAEKEQLIKEKKIKRTSKLPEITKDEIPYEIPKSWQWVRLGDLGVIQTGNTPKKNEKENYNGNIPFIKPNDIFNDHINYKTTDYLSDSGEKKGRIVFNDTLLVTCIGNLGRNYVINRKVAFNQQINSLTLFNNINSYLIHYFIMSPIFQNFMYKASSATTVRILNKSKFANLLVPLPPLAEQQRIVTKIEKIFAKLK